jgi:hypothetical protein
LGSGEAGTGDLRKDFFSEEKKQKTFTSPQLHIAGKRGTSLEQEAKVFWFFFSKKNILPSFVLRRSHEHHRSPQPKPE